jgi:plastocyanin
MSTARCGSTGTRRRRRAVLPALGGLALALVTACGPSPASGAAAAPGTAASSVAPSSGQAVIHIRGFGYQVPASVGPGATVGVMNMDGEAHSVTADDGAAFDASVTGDATGGFTAPTEPGSYPFHCSYHSTMHGVLVVK